MTFCKMWSPAFKAVLVSSCLIIGKQLHKTNITNSVDYLTYQGLLGSGRLIQPRLVQSAVPFTKRICSGLLGKKHTKDINSLCKKLASASRGRKFVESHQ